MSLAFYNNQFGEIFGKAKNLMQADSLLSKKGLTYADIMYLKEQSQLLILKSKE